MSRYNVCKHFLDFPCSHRAWKHDGQCKLLHGYCRTISLYFSSDTLDDNGFVIDLSALKTAEKWLRKHFDHAVILAEDDPLLHHFLHLERQGGMKITIVENVSSEGMGEYIANHIIPSILVGMSADEVVVTKSRKDEPLGDIVKRVVTLESVGVVENLKISGLVSTC